ncbi:hypothetical protein B0H13DRAFT_1913304 [Mycena leptocephala]|nr:hypothetical protein B0H13DRAFT_1913304 [Mycena leptocephala]
MPLVKDLLGSIINYRLGYAPTRPYAWRWTTPVTFGVFLVATIILTLINVPLSAYTIFTETTYTPNASLPALPLSHLVPSILQESSYSGSFSPQTLTLGQIIRLNGSIYSYNITGAYNGFDTSQAVPSFFYFNNPLSDSCDITVMTISGKSDGIRASVQITCWTPTVYILSFDMDSIFWSTNNSDSFQGASLYDLYLDLRVGWESWGSNLPGVQIPHGSKDYPLASCNLTGFEITVRPCCDCDGNGDVTWNTGIFSLDHPPSRCSEAPADFLAFDSTVFLQLPDTYMVRLGTSNNTDFFVADELDRTSFAGLNTLLHNLFQAIYHSVRLDLGILQPNQIYTSADMYNRSISTVYIPGVFFEGGSERVYANTSRRDSSNLITLWTAEQQDVVRVPIMSYIRTVPRLKPLGAAITSVFVSTFAMVSVLWQVFSFIAAALSGNGNGNPSDDKEVESLRETVEQMRRAAPSHKGSGKSILIIGSILRANSSHLDKKEESILRANWNPSDNKKVESLRVTVEQMRRAALFDKENGNILPANTSPLDNKEVESLRVTVEQMRQAALSDKGNGRSIFIIGSILRANSSPLDKKEVESLKATVEQMRRAAGNGNSILIIGNNKEVESLRATVEQMRQALHKHGLIVTDEESEDMGIPWTNEQIQTMQKMTKRRLSRIHTRFNHCSKLDRNANQLNCDIGVTEVINATRLDSAQVDFRIVHFKLFHMSFLRASEKWLFTSHWSPTLKNRKIYKQKRLAKWPKTGGKIATLRALCRPHTTRTPVCFDLGNKMGYLGPESGRSRFTGSKKVLKRHFAYSGHSDEASAKPFCVEDEQKADNNYSCIQILVNGNYGLEYLEDKRENDMADSLNILGRFLYLQSGISNHLLKVDKTRIGADRLVRGGYLGSRASVAQNDEHLEKWAFYERPAPDGHRRGVSLEREMPEARERGKTKPCPPVSVAPAVKSPQREMFHEGNETTASLEHQIQIDRGVTHGKELENEILWREPYKGYMANVLTPERCMPLAD